MINRMHSVKSPIPAIFLVLFVCLGCTGENWEPGVVAKVDGKSIYLREMEAKYDFDHFEWSVKHMSHIQDVKKEYRDILLELIVQKLVQEKLKEMGEAVSKEEVRAKEEKIREDYPQGAFENILVEEYIDLNYWRKQLKAGLQWKRFKEVFLKPRAEVGLKEVKRYYRKNAQDFVVPKRKHFVLLRGPLRKEVKKAHQEYKEGVSLEKIRERHDDLTVHEYTLRAEQIPPRWSPVLKQLQPGQSSELKNHNTDFYVLHFIENKEEKVLEPYRAYALIEKKLLRKKEKAIFVDWLKHRLADIEIELSKRLKKENSVEG